MPSSSYSADHQDNAMIREEKQRLRKEIRAKLKALSEDDIREESLQVWNRLFQLPAYQKARSIGLFLSMPKGEIDTDPALHHAVAKGMDIYVPEVGKNFEQAEMELRKVILEDDAADSTKDPDGRLFHRGWPRNKWGIPEPPADMPLRTAQPGDIDILVVPGLAFDRTGERLGQGKGYYDRFLHRMMEVEKKPFLVAVGLSCQLVPSIPVWHHDHPLDMILLPNETIVADKN